MTNAIDHHAGFAVPTSIGPTVHLVPVGSLTEDQQRAFRELVHDIMCGHVVESFSGRETVRGDPAQLAGVWAACIANVDGLAAFPSAIEAAGDPISALRQLGAGRHPRGWDYPDASTAQRMLLWLTDRSSAPVLADYLNPNRRTPR